MTLILAFFLGLMNAAHPVHVSVTNLEVDRSKREITITQKLNAEDYSLLFFHLYEKQVRFVAGDDLTETELTLIDQYLNTAFFLELGTTRLPLAFTGKEQDEESIWLHYTCKLPDGNLSSVTLTNNLLLALFEDQTNLVIVSADQEQKGYTFTVNKWKCDIDLSLQ